MSGNVFFNGPRAGINANDGFGGGDEISHNLVFSTCRESGDHGPFNSWDRQPFLTTVRDGSASMTMAWREIHHNFFIDNYSPQARLPPLATPPSRRPSRRPPRRRRMSTMTTARRTTRRTTTSSSTAGRA